MKIIISLLTIIFFLPSLGLTNEEIKIPEILDADAINDKIDPCNDFYQFSCGSWIEKAVIPADRKAIYKQITPMADTTDITLNKILENYAQDKINPPATFGKLLGDYYKSCMHTKEDKAQSLKIVNDQIKDIVVRNRQDLASLTADLHKMGVGDLFFFTSIQDLNDSTKVIGDLSQGGMSLTNPAYYLQTDAKSKEIRQKFTEYVAHLLTLFGFSSAQAISKAQVILKMEIELAKHAYSVADQSDPIKVNHVMTADQLMALAPAFNWKIYFNRLGFSDNVINVEEPEFFSYLNTFLTNSNRDDLDSYLIFHWLDRASEKIDGEFEQIHFAFWNSYLNGAKTMLPRWKYCTQAVEQNLGYALAEGYVQLFDQKAIKEKTESMIDQIKTAFKENLASLGWLDEGTIEKALEKVSLMSRKVGAPEKFRNYTSLVISEHSYLQNTLNITNFEYIRALAKIGKPVDRSEWLMMPWDINAYYDRSMNEFVFPYGILLPPSLDLKAGDGANFGSFGGSTIGHELTHGFDNNGAKYDAQGNLKNWWSTKTQSQFEQKAQCYVDQANAYKIKAVDMFVNGNQTLEENLADQGGIKLGYKALSKILSTRPESPLWLQKYNERQQYWIAYAQAWCTKYTDELLRLRMTNDTHPPSEFRVNAVIMNQSEFAKDFQCHEGTRMAPSNRCSLW